MVEGEIGTVREGVFFNIRFTGTGGVVQLARVSEEYHRRHAKRVALSSGDGAFSGWAFMRGSVEICCSVDVIVISTMLHLERPHVNVLSKVDLMDKYGELAFNLEFYTEVQDLSYLAEYLNSDPKFKEYNKLTNSIMEIIEDFGLVRFTAMSIEDFDSVNRVCQLCDKSIGYSPEFHKNLKNATRERQFE